MREPDSRPEQSPCIEESAAVCEIWSDHDECLYRKKGGRIHEGRQAKGLHRRCDCFVISLRRKKSEHLMNVL